MTTNYRNTFIAVAPDCPAAAATTPPAGAKPTVARLQYDLLSARPYELTSDELLFEVHLQRGNIGAEHRSAEWERFFAKPQACVRSSPLAKRYGWGLHHDDQERIALVGVGTAEYLDLAASPEVEQKVAMRSSRRRA